MQKGRKEKVGSNGKRGRKKGRRKKNNKEETKIEIERTRSEDEKNRENPGRRDIKMRK